MSNQSIASVSLDLDNKWAYLKTHGDPSWTSFPSYLDLVVPRITEMLDSLGMQITFFIVGQDAAIDSNHEALAQIAKAGHEIANHSFNHEPWLHLYSSEKLEAEFVHSEQAILSATGIHPVGFRGPGFSYSDQVLKTLINRGYKYDCTIFPTFLGPIARAYYFFRSSLNRSQKNDRKNLFGKWSDGFQSNRPFKWYGPTGSLFEIPVTTFPFAKIPIHLSYILFLSRYSSMLARLYFWSAIKACKVFRVSPSILLHPTDFLGADDEPDLSFFPAMDIPSQKKVEMVRWTLLTLKKNFRVTTTLEHAQSLSDTISKRSIDSAPTAVEN
jgi:peptidoglycan-N-acetylglucosamine deacetylase